jgi:hypothetical protein
MTSDLRDRAGKKPIMYSVRSTLRRKNTDLPLLQNLSERLVITNANIAWARSQ